MLQTSACHSGENTANGQKAAAAGLSFRYASRATGGTRSGSAVSATKASASGGPSISTRSGWKSDKAVNTARAEPGPWCRIPSTRTRSVRTAWVIR